MNDDFLSISPADTEVPQLHGILLAAVAPRPIALASTVDREGRPNLAPFSYFNVFSTRPPLLIVGPNRSGRTAKHKDTALNAMDTHEMVINIVNYPMVQQVNVASAEYPAGVNEFDKAGFTPIPSELVKPFRVKESPVQIECKVRQVVTLGATGGSGVLIICEAVLIHANKAYLNDKNGIDTRKLDLVGRMGGNYYVHANGDALFELPKPSSNQIIGFEGLPAHVLDSLVLTGNDLGKLAQLEPPTDQTEMKFMNFNGGKFDTMETLHQAARFLIYQNKVAEAYNLLLQGSKLIEVSDEV